jgi:hypothetical protein
MKPLLQKHIELHFKKVLDHEGNFKSLEIWQDDQHITISLANTFAGGNHSFVWGVLRETIDKLQEQVSKI